MKKLTLRTEHLGELSADDLRRIAGAANRGEVPGTISDGSCVCTRGLELALPCDDISRGSCVCTSS